MRPKLQEEDSEITKMSIFMLNYYQDAEAHIDKMEDALKEIAKGDGKYDLEPLKHAGNCIDNMKEIAEQALK